MNVEGPPPPPPYSPDGRFYWNGQQWVPVQPAVAAGRKRSSLPLLALGCLGLIVLVVIVIAAVGSHIKTSSPGGSATPTPLNVTARVGQPITNQAKESTTVVSFRRNFISANVFQRPPAGKECVLVTLALSNASTSEWSSPLSEMHLVDSLGQKYDGTTGCGELPEEDHIQGIRASGYASVSMLFEVAVGIPVNFSWTPSSFPSDSFVTPLR